MVKSRQRIDCSACGKLKGCTQTLVDPKDSDTSSRKSCVDCDDSECVFVSPNRKVGDDEKCSCHG